MILSIVNIVIIIMSLLTLFAPSACRMPLLDIVAVWLASVSCFLWLYKGNTRTIACQPDTFEESFFSREYDEYEREQICSGQKLNQEQEAQYRQSETGST